jgi:hypothetical protein
MPPKHVRPADSEQAKNCKLYEADLRQNGRLVSSKRSGRGIDPDGRIGQRESHSGVDGR